MTFQLGSASLENLSGGTDAIQAIVKRAIQITDVDFSVIETKRSWAKQVEMVAKRKSWTMESKHLTGEAVDIYPWVHGKTNHAPMYYNRIAKAMFQAAFELDQPIEWGGFWWQRDKSGTGLDRPHFELVNNVQNG